MQTRPGLVVSRNDPLVRVAHTALMLTIISGLLAGSADAQRVTLPSGYATATSYANNPAPFGTGAVFGLGDCVNDGGDPGTPVAVLTYGIASAAASRSCRFNGLIPTLNHAYAPFSAGNFTTTGSASLLQGQWLKAAAQLSGTMAPNVMVFSTASAVYDDAITVTGPITPASVVFTMAIHGTFTDTYGNTANGVYQPDPNSPTRVESGRVDLSVLRFDANGRQVGGSGAGSVHALGDGSTESGTFTVPWSEAFGNTLAYELQLNALADGYNFTAADENVFVDSNYSDTAGLTSITVYDAAGNDITNVDGISFASGAAPRGIATTATPEPASLSLVAIGLVGLNGVVRRRKRRD